MSIYHDEIEIEDMEYDEEAEIYYYPCPCGDKFEISKVTSEVGASPRVALADYNKSLSSLILD